MGTSISQYPWPLGAGERNRRCEPYIFPLNHSHHWYIPPLSTECGQYLLHSFKHPFFFSVPRSSSLLARHFSIKFGSYDNTQYYGRRLFSSCCAYHLTGIYLKFMRCRLTVQDGWIHPMVPQTTINIRGILPLILLLLIRRMVRPASTSRSMVS